jgi:hypothetical protein
MISEVTYTENTLMKLTTSIRLVKSLAMRYMPQQQVLVIKSFIIEKTYTRGAFSVSKYPENKFHTTLIKK